MNAFKSKTINITRVNNPCERQKIHEKNIYERFNTNDNINERYNYKSIPLKLMESKSNSKEKINKALKKFEQNTNYSNQYCITLNPKSQKYSKNLYLHSHSNSSEKKKSSRPSTAIQKNISKKLRNDGFMIYNEKNYLDFNNFRDNLLSNNKREKENINKKLFPSNINKNINQNNPFIKQNNKLSIKTNNIGFFNQNFHKAENNIYNRTISNNEKRLITPKIILNHLMSENNRPKSGKKLKLASTFMLRLKKEK